MTGWKLKSSDDKSVAHNIRFRSFARGQYSNPDTGDMREAPSIPLVMGPLDMGTKLRAHDPAGIEQARCELPDIKYFDDP
jgi:UDPglucose 6-dehydrogenase